jgi:uncharacterized protein YjiS (DUF1127 family)
MTRHPSIGPRLLRTVTLWRARAQERRTLAAMTHRELRDIGISPGEANAEARKPFWTA